MSIDHDKKPDDLYGVSAGRDYDDEVRRFIREGRVEPAAATARRSVDGPDGQALHDAEMEAARRGAMPGDPPWLARVRAAAHHAVDRVLSSVVRAEDWWKAHEPKARYDGDGRPRH
jgi:hypothetical protein